MFPYIRYIKYALSKYPYEDLKKRFIAISLPFISENDIPILKKISLKKNFPKVFEPIFYIPTFYLQISSLILAKIPEADILALLPAFKNNLNDYLPYFDGFIYYFADFSFLSPVEFESYLDKLKKINPKLFECYRLALEENRDELIWRIGLKPTSLPTQTILPVLYEILSQIKATLKDENLSLQKKALIVEKLGNIFDRLYSHFKPIELSELERDFQILLKTKEDEFFSSQNP